MLIHILRYDVFIQPMQNIYFKNDGGKISLQEADGGNQGFRNKWRQSSTNKRWTYGYTTCLEL